ncbi:transposase [Streptomyces sp. NPDC014779]|uniref:transposase n=1 Tax=Streptomyces sp. NPDC014779 TaxID=3364911 RepID=UPI0036FB69B2
MGVRPAVAARAVSGRRRPDDRGVLNGIVWSFRTGAARRDVPERYGPGATACAPCTVPRGSGCSVSFSPRSWLATVRYEVTATGEV